MRTGSRATTSSLVVVGSLNRDCVIEAPRRPAPGETVTGARVSWGAGGKGANQAAAAALLGAAVTLIGRVGEDLAAGELLAALHAAGVDTHAVTTSPSEATGTAFITVTPDGENSIIVASGANASLGRDDLERNRLLLMQAGVVLLQLEVSDEAVETAVELAGLNSLIVLNAAPLRPISPTLLGRIDLLVVNDVEARQLLGVEANLDDSREFERLGPRATVVTLGGEGATAYTEGKRVAVAAPHVRVVDTTGAGDAFVGALGAWLAGEGIGHGDPLVPVLEPALAAASVAAAYSVGRLGTQSSYGRRAEVGPPWS